MGKDLKDSEKADLAKIHAEINQILNQRYNLVILTITVFGLFMASLTQKDKFNLEIYTIKYEFFLVLFFLGVLTYLSIITSGLTKQFYILRAYLISAELSDWEINFEKFRRNEMKREHFGYSKTTRYIFFIIGITILCVGYLNQFIKQKIDFAAAQNFLAPLLYLVIGVVYVWFIYIIYYPLEQKEREKRLLDSWRIILNNENNKSD
ncbi:hypothetical protein [Cellulophaga sp. BC115SP]|uniref:hypothetical protein n=1 Tax=Cellulophaga sp. BC115SP TaxID=2683263 RepID=UPI001411FC15|nr:hypothetical protein [Cellulophaga sp. BC115SP]NBB31798.1 hypothetical protein [Cellulophaga sp. BC115SP]